jgi:hypothetical protein
MDYVILMAIVHMIQPLSSHDAIVMRVMVEILALHHPVVVLQPTAYQFKLD